MRRQSPGREAGNDRIEDRAGNDTLLGGSGRDALLGGLGADTLTGGDDADVFQFRTVAEAQGDVVRDFSAAQRDRIHLNAIDANTTVAGNQAFSWIGTAAFGAVAGQLRFANGMVQGDVDGDNLTDFAVTLDVTTSLSRVDVFL